MQTTLLEHLRKVKAHLLSHPVPSCLAPLIQFNTGILISEPVVARLDDLVLDYDISHLWVRKNNLTDRKTLDRIRCVPLLGVSRTHMFRLAFIDGLKVSNDVLGHLLAYLNC